MSSITWGKTVYDDLRKGHYKKVVEYYESLLEKEPEVLECYWRLGLAYLLDEQEEEAQLTWFLALNQPSEKDAEQNIHALVEVLEEEAKYQEAEKNNLLAWLIRGHIRELQATNISNLLSLLVLNLELDYPTIPKLAEWNVIQLLELEEISPYESFFLPILSKILYIADPETINFARICLNTAQNPDSILKTIVEVAKKINDQDGAIDHPVMLVNVCRENNPNDLELLKTLFWFYAGTNYFDESLAIAIEFSEKSESLSAKIFADHQLLYLYLSRSDWDSALPIATKHIVRLTSFVDQKDIYFEGFMAATLPILSHPLLYLQDNAKENRHISNQLGNYFQKIINLDIVPQDNSDKKTNNTLEINQDRPLKIGYIGYTFRSQSVGWLSRWLIHYHDPEKFDIYIY